MIFIQQLILPLDLMNRLLEWDRRQGFESRIRSDLQRQGTTVSELTEICYQRGLEVDKLKLEVAKKLKKKQKEVKKLAKEAQLLGITNDSSAEDIEKWAG